MKSVYLFFGVLAVVMGTLWLYAGFNRESPDFITALAGISSIVFGIFFIRKIAENFKELNATDPNKKRAEKAFAMALDEIIIFALPEDIFIRFCGTDYKGGQCYFCELRSERIADGLVRIYNDAVYVHVLMTMNTKTDEISNYRMKNIISIWPVRQVDEYRKEFDEDDVLEELNEKG